MGPKSILMQGFKGACGPLQWQFDQALQRPDLAQNRVKMVILRRLAKTAYGASLGLGRSAPNLDQWQRVPLVTYGDLQPWIDRQRQAVHSAILTPDRILFWEPTSGSTGPRKWIPYTPPLITSFSLLFCLWAADILHHGPPLRSGKTYLCISPEIIPNSEGGSSPVPRSGTDDTDYIHPLLARLLDRFLVRVGQRFRTVEAFRWELALNLLRSPDLEVMSLWSPSFLTTQLAFMAQQGAALRSALGGEVAPDRLRLLEVDPVPWAEVWPDLRLISCWDRRGAADSAAAVRRLFPQVLVQGKGLLATEGPVTLPLLRLGSFVPLLSQVVLEFLDEQGRIWGLAALEQGRLYEVVLSQQGGLCRYRLGDRVRVSGWAGATPCLEFVGRGETVSDQVGEKLALAFVEGCLAAGEEVLGWPIVGFRCLAPVRSRSGLFYALVLDREPVDRSRLATVLEAQLRLGFHYDRARCFNQLGPLQVWVDPQVADRLWGHKRLGDCKYPLLLTDVAKASEFV